MGRIYWDAKSTVESKLQLNIFKLNQWGVLRDGCQGILTCMRSTSKKKSRVGFVVEIGERPNIRLLYTTTKRDGETIDSDYRIWLTWTACRYGGKRYWFCCPYCGRRVGTLYLMGQYDKFICRECSNLSYESRNESYSGRISYLGYLLKLKRQSDELRKKVKRWTYAGRPTKKAMKLYWMETIFNQNYTRWKKPKAANRCIL